MLSFAEQLSPFCSKKKDTHLLRVSSRELKVLFLSVDV